MAQCKGSQYAVATRRDTIDLYEPTEVSPPGATIADLLEERGLSQAQLAERMGLPVERVRARIEGRAAIGRDVAVGV